MSILVANKHRIYVTYDDSRDPREAATAQLIEMFARLRLAVMYLGDMTTDLTDSISGDIDILDSIASHASPPDHGLLSTIDRISAAMHGLCASEINMQLCKLALDELLVIRAVWQQTLDRLAAEQFISPRPAG
tara:strand:+ start:323 stop:721 length:399 start_codon:yes stop_codon:yes gene_type:complete